MQLPAYRAVRASMLPGDLLSFGGRGAISEGIKLVTGSPVSHVGIVALSEPIEGAGWRVDVVESTSLDGFCGVTRSRLSARLLAYAGEVWWMPLAARVRERLDISTLFAFLQNQDGKPYDAPQAILAGLARLGLPGRCEDVGRLFCSELVAAALEAAGAIGALNASRVTPAGLVEWAIYRDCVQLVGEPRPVPRFNSLPVGERGLEGV